MATTDFNPIRPPLIGVGEWESGGNECIAYAFFWMYA